MKIFFLTVASLCLGFSACAQNFFDYSDEGKMFARFRDFESRKISSIRSLENYGVLAKKVDQENLTQATQIACGVWSCILQESLPNQVDFTNTDETLLREQFWQFRRHYQGSVPWDEINSETRKYLILFSRIEGIIYTRGR